MPDYDPDELVTVDQIADRHGCDAATVRGWRHRGLMPEPAERIGKRVLRWHWRDVAGLRVGERALGRPQAKGGGT